MLQSERADAFFCIYVSCFQHDKKHLDFFEKSY